MEEPRPSGSPGESNEPAPARGPGHLVRAWGGAGLSVWKLPDEPNRRVDFNLLRFVGPVLSVVLAALAHRITGDAVAGVVGLLLGYPVALLLMGAWNLRSREEPRRTRLHVTERALLFHGGTAPIEIPFDRIAAFHPADADGGRAARITLRLTDGDPAHLEIASSEAAPLIEALDARLPSSLASTGLRPALLRQGRSLEAWRADLQKLASTGGGYRGGSLPVDHLLAAVRDDRLSPEERIGAALALGGRSAPEQREKLRIAAKEVRTTGLRIAVDHVLDGTIDEADVEYAAEEEGRRAKG